MHNIFTTRRAALKALGAVALSGVASQLLLATRATAALASPATTAAATTTTTTTTPTAAAAGQGLTDFIAVSRTLTGKAQLNPALALALYQALVKTAPAIDAALAGLKTTLSADAGAVLAQDGTTTFADAQQAEQALSQAILQAWYLGVVGKGKKSVCVAYVETLANQAVADVLMPPSYSYGPCGSWSAKPGSPVKRETNQ